MRAAFLDKDGTLVEDIAYNVDPARIKLMPNAGQGLRLLRDAGFALVVITNQPGVARGLFAESALAGVEARLRELLRSEDVILQGFIYCPHSPEGVVARYAHACACRKPLPGMLHAAAHQHGIDLAASWMIGDILNDVEAGRRAGCRTVLLDNGHETEWLPGPLRQPDIIAADLLGAALAIDRSKREERAN